MNKTYTAFLADRETHKLKTKILIKVDGYMSALVEASKQCKEQYPELYVASVQLLQ